MSRAGSRRHGGSARRQRGRPAGRDYVAARLKQAGVVPIGDRFERCVTFTSRTGGPRHGTNLVGAIRGTRDPNRYIVADRALRSYRCAEWPARRRSGRQRVGCRGAPGPGGALCVESAGAFAGDRRARRRRRGTAGSEGAMRDPPVPVTAMVVNVNMDMVGRDPEQALCRRHPPVSVPEACTSKRRLQPPVVLAFGHDTPGHVAEGPEQDWTADSDHYVFHQAGIPFVRTLATRTSTSITKRRMIRPRSTANSSPGPRRRRSPPSASSTLISAADRRCPIGPVDWLHRRLRGRSRYPAVMEVYRLVDRVHVAALGTGVVREVRELASIPR